MALPSAVALDLRNALRGFRAANGPTVVPTTSGRAMEAWLMMSLARAAQTSGRWTVSLRRGDGTPLAAGNAFPFAAFQSGILPSNPSGPGFVQLDRTHGTPLALELHGSLQWKGRSNATHELDVSLMPQVLAQALRVAGGHPRGLPIGRCHH